MLAPTLEGVSLAESFGFFSGGELSFSGSELEEDEEEASSGEVLRFLCGGERKENEEKGKRRKREEERKKKGERKEEERQLKEKPNSRNTLLYFLEGEKLSQSTTPGRLQNFLPCSALPAVSSPPWLPSVS